MKVKGLDVVPERLLTVNVLVWPGLMVAGLAEHVVPALQPTVIWLVKFGGAEAVTVKVAEVVPMTTGVEGGATANEKTATPVPVSDTF